MREKREKAAELVANIPSTTFPFYHQPPHFPPAVLRRRFGRLVRERTRGTRRVPLSSQPPPPKPVTILVPNFCLHLLQRGLGAFRVNRVPPLRPTSSQDVRHADDIYSFHSPHPSSPTRKLPNCEIVVFVVRGFGCIINFPRKQPHNFHWSGHSARSEEREK